jgi:tellurite resistance protein TerC
MSPILRHARRVVIAVIGTTVLLIGIALLVLPGPAFVVIPVGLAILATEFAWARRWLQIVRESAEKGAAKLGLRDLFSRGKK